MANEIAGEFVHYSCVLVYITTRGRQHDFVLDEISDIFFCIVILQLVIASECSV